jgi:hypothetical protein
MIDAPILFHFLHQKGDRVVLISIAVATSVPVSACPQVV